MALTLEVDPLKLELPKEGIRFPECRAGLLASESTYAQRIQTPLS